MESERVYPLAIKYLRQGYPSFKFSTYKWHRCGHFGLLVRRKGYTDEGVGEARHKAFKDSIRRSSRRGEDVQAARMAEEEAGLLRGQRMAALRDALLVCTRQSAAMPSACRSCSTSTCPHGHVMPRGIPRCTRPAARATFCA